MCTCRNGYIFLTTVGKRSLENALQLTMVSHDVFLHRKLRLVMGFKPTLIDAISEHIRSEHDHIYTFKYFLLNTFIILFLLL